MTRTGPDVRILQIHPATRSNLRRIDRYTSSGLQERGELGAPLLISALADAVGMGYNMLALAGGDPLRYEGLEAVCREAQRQHMIATVVTPGDALMPLGLKRLRGLVDLLVITVDGGRSAFTSIEPGLAAVRESGMPFALGMTLTPETLPDLEWAADFAVARGALMLQIGATEACGSGTATAWMVVECLREIHRGRLAIHLDASNRYHLPATPESVTRWQRTLDSGTHGLSEMLSPLVIEEDGTVAPLRHGFPRAFAFGSLRERPLAALASEWTHRRAAAFCDLYRKTLRKVRVSGRMFVNLDELMANEAAAPAVRASAI